MAAFRRLPQVFHHEKSADKKKVQAVKVFRHPTSPTSFGDGSKPIVTIFAVINIH